MKRKNPPIPAKSASALRLAAGFVIISLALIAIMGYIFRALKNFDYFKVTEIVTRQANPAGLSYLKGRNIFGIDLRNESRLILEYYPDASSVRLSRVLPDRIFVDFVKRRPVAWVSLHRDFAVDENGVLFYPADDWKEAGLPVISGLERKIIGPKPGKAYNVRELRLALNIIKEAKRNRILSVYKIKRIDAANSASASIFIGPPQEAGEKFLEVKLNADNIKNKIAILGNLLIQEKNSLDNIKYVDLRFNEPVVRFSDVKSK